MDEGERVRVIIMYERFKRIVVLLRALDQL